MDGYTIIRCEKLDYDFVLKVNDAIARGRIKFPIAIEVVNTSKIEREALKYLNDRVKIRVIGPYTDDYVRRYPNSKDTAFYNSLYDREELYRIIKNFETIESRIDPSWSDLDKMVYLINTISRNIWYDPEYYLIHKKNGVMPERVVGKQDESDYYDRTLRGILRRKTVCAGYSVIFKELMNRNGMKCRYVRGKTKSGGGHAWNIVEIDGQLHPIDVTWKNTRYRAGDMGNIDFIACDLDEFDESHIPYGEEPRFQMSSLGRDDVRNSLKKVTMKNNFTSSTRHIERSDGTCFGVTQIGSWKGYQRYIYWEIDENGNYGIPRLVFSESNLTKEEEDFRFERSSSAHYDSFMKSFKDVLFSKRNIEASRNADTRYLGKCERCDGNGFVRSVDEIVKSSKASSLLSMKNAKSARRDDGSMLTVIKFDNTDGTSEKFVYYVYDVRGKGKNATTICYKYYSDDDMFSEKASDIVNGIFSSQNLESYSTSRSA